MKLTSDIALELIENIKNYNNYENTFWYNGFKRVITNYKRTSIKIKYGEDNYVSLEGLEVIDYNIIIQSMHRQIK